MIMYDFAEGAVVLGIRAGKYYISKNGSEIDRQISEEQASNPMLAINEYTSAIHEYLRSRAKTYLQTSKGNTVMGCKYDNSCLGCDHRGQAGSRCLFMVDKEEMQ